MSVGQFCVKLEGECEWPVLAQYCSFTQKNCLMGLLATMAARRSAGQSVWGLLAAPKTCGARSPQARESERFGRDPGTARCVVWSSAENAD